MSRPPPAPVCLLGIGSLSLVFLRLMPLSYAFASDSQSPPQLKTEPRAELPSEAEIGSAGLSILLELTIEADGSVSEVKILESRGEVLDDAARLAALKMTFEPAMLNGEAHRSKIKYRSVFRVSPTKNKKEADPKKHSELSATGVSGLPAPTEESANPEWGIPEAPQSGEQIVVVTGSRVPEKQKDAVVQTQVISRESMRQMGALTLGDALEAQLGLQISQSFRGSELWIRGLDPEYTLILIDGERLPGRTGGALDLSRYPLENVERVEIVRGPSSALYGSDAIGGVVNIITRENDKDLESDAEARLGTNQAVAGSFRLAARPTEKLGVALSGGYQHSDAFKANPYGEATTGSSRTLSAAGGSIAWGKPRGDRLRLSIDYTQVDLRGVDAGAGNALFDRTQVQEQFVSSLNYRAEIGSLYLQSIAQYSTFREQYLLDQRGATQLDHYEDNQEHIGQVTTTVAKRWSSAHRSTAGIEVLGQILDSERLNDRGFRARYSLFAEHRATLLSEEDEKPIFSLVPGVRLDIDSQFGSQLSPKLALRYDPSESWVLRASYGRRFRAPSFQELLLRFENPSVGYVVEGNPDLRAESSHSIELSGDFRPDRSVLFSAAAYYNLLTDMISTITKSEGSATGTEYSYDNIDQAWTRGFDTQAVWSANSELSIMGGYTYMQTWDESRNRPLVGRPVHRFVFKVTENYDPWGLIANFRGSIGIGRSFYVDDNNDGVDEEVTAPAIAQLDFRVAKTFNESFEMFFGINNIADAGDRFTTLLPRQFYVGIGGKL